MAIQRWHSRNNNQRFLATCAVLDIITVSLISNLYRKELVISDLMLIPNEYLTLGQGEYITVETTASANTPRLALWLITREYGAYHLLNKPSLRKATRSCLKDSLN